ncbi:MAG: NADH-quinone oxidoreductase subunit NuoH [Candidatus Omnitrophica bacterium]|nr:NADH-quinone oxidoreductase subunit NuoH [Candidatus Omnitrophota bacterium]
MGLIGILIGVVLILALAPVVMMYATWMERKTIARMQDRFGPTRVGRYGLLQPLADGVKMLTKEDIVPRGADRMAHTLAPIVIVIPALLLFAVIPLGPKIILADLNTGLLFFLAVSSVETLAIFMAGWGSRSKFSLLGAIRSAAQIIAYEVPMVLNLAVVVMMAGSMSTAEIVQAQTGRWFLATPWGFAGFAVFFICALAEVNRTPFDLPEAESELVGGFHTEYSGMKFALFYMAEYLSVFAVSALGATLFLGGWMGPILPGWAWLLIKTYGLVFVMIWIRGTWPRFRIDQLMAFAWKCLLPVSLANVLAAGVWYILPAPWGALTCTLLLAATFLITSQLWIPKARRVENPAL